MRGVAAIELEWVEPLALHLVATAIRRRWHARAGQAFADEKGHAVMGIPIVPRRKVAYGRIDPVESRSLFIRYGLTEGDMEHARAVLAAQTARSPRAARRRGQGGADARCWSTKR